MALRAKKPEDIRKRPKFFLFGVAGCGKTIAAIQMPRPYIIDTERGAENKTYVDLIKKANGALFQTTNADDIIAELKALITEKHDYRTIVIDPITNIEDNVIQSAAVRYGADAKDNGDLRVWRDRDKFMRRIVALLLQADMNVVMTAHSKIEYGPNMVKLGRTFEGWKKWDYLFDLVLELRIEGEKRIATVRKSRLEAFPQGSDFEWSYQELVKRYGSEIMEKAVTPVVMANADQVAELNRLVETVKLPDGTVEKWLTKAGVEVFADMPSDVIAKCIEWTKSRLNKTAEKE